MKAVSTCICVPVIVGGEDEFRTSGILKYRSRIVPVYFFLGECGNVKTGNLSFSFDGQLYTSG